MKCRAVLVRYRAVLVKRFPRPFCRWILSILGLSVCLDVIADLPASVWDGIYTEQQARRGGEIYPSVCGRCHGYQLDGAPDDPDMFPTPPIAGTKFIRNWNGRSLAALFDYTRTTMPENNPGFLSDREFIEIVSYMLAMSAMPPGPTPLRADVLTLAGIVIEPKP